MALRELLTDISLHGELNWGVRGDTNETGLITSLETNEISTMYFHGAAPVLGGLVNPTTDKEKLMFLFYVGTGTLTITHQNASSTDVKRIILPYNANILVYPNEAAILFYDSVEYRWRFLGKSTTYIPELISTGEAKVNEFKVTRDGGSTINTSGDLNNVNVSSQSIVRFTAATSVSGFIASLDDNGKLLFAHNASSVTLFIKNNSSASDPANRIITGTGGDYKVFPGAAILLQYDGDSSLWRMISSPGTFDNQGGNLSYSIYSYGNISTNANLDLSDLDQGGGTFKHTNTSSSVLTLINGIPGRRYKIFGISNGTSYSFAATNGVYYSQGVSPIISPNNKTDIFYFECIAADKYLCSYVYNFDVNIIEQTEKQFMSQVDFSGLL